MCVCVFERGDSECVCLKVERVSKCVFVCMCDCVFECLIHFYGLIWIYCNFFQLLLCLCAIQHTCVFGVSTEPEIVYARVIWLEFYILF